MNNSVRQELKKVTPNDFVNFCDNLEWKIGFLGGRRLIHKNRAIKGSLCLNDLVKSLDVYAKQKFSSGSGGSEADPVKVLKDSVSKIQSLDRFGSVYLYINANVIRQILSAIKSSFSSLFYQREKVLNRIGSLVSKDVQSIEIPKVKPQPLSEEMKNFINLNPFIHGTSSLIFAHLSHTEQKLLSLKDLLYKKLAPFGGEIFLGGTNHMISKGATSFGKIFGASYDLARVLQSYARSGIKKETERQLLEDFKAAIEKGLLTQALIMVTRARQYGFSMSKNQDVKEGMTSLCSFLCISLINSYCLVPFLTKFVRLQNLSSEKSQEFLKELRELLDKNQIDLSKYAFKDSLPKEGEDRNIDNIRQSFEVYQWFEGKGCSLYDIPQKGSESIVKEDFEEKIYNSMIGIEHIGNLEDWALNHPERIVEHAGVMEELYTPFLEDIRKHFELIKEMWTSEEDMTLQIPPEDKDLVEKPFL